VKAQALPDGAERIDTVGFLFRGAERRSVRLAYGCVKFVFLKRDHSPLGVAPRAFKRTVDAVNCRLIGGGDAANFDVTGPLDDNCKFGRGKLVADGRILANGIQNGQ
jgi:hypothetical protein